MTSLVHIHGWRHNWQKTFLWIFFPRFALGHIPDMLLIKVKPLYTVISWYFDTLTLIWCILGKCKSVISGKKIHNSVFSLWWRHVYRTAYYVMITCDVITEATYRHHDISHVWKKYHVMKVGYAQILGNPQSVIYGKKIQTKIIPYWEHPKASFVEKTSKTYNFQ